MFLENAAPFQHHAISLKILASERDPRTAYSDNLRDHFCRPGWVFFACVACFRSPPCRYLAEEGSMPCRVFAREFVARVDSCSSRRDYGSLYSRINTSNESQRY